MLLTFFDEGSELEIEDIKGKDDIRKHLASLGFTKGQRFKIYKKDGDNFILLKDASRIAISFDLARRIYVKELR
ncbi:MAG: FeoA family protein [Peptoniphilaceae bacterium]|nr:ferrous iron transport protein A [Anaerococcus sp.]MDD7045439.1 FeoA family protein [Peptoniphilaceae bacterium]